jgi:large subunit ribosomal protein L14
MLQKNSIISVADDSAKKCMIIGIFNGRKSVYIGDVVTVVVKIGIEGSDIKKGTISKALIIRTKGRYTRNDGSYYFSDDACILIDNQEKMNIEFYKEIMSSATEII